MSEDKTHGNLTVGDLFCGAGGFAEGFRQAGFDIRWAVDIWPPATKTFEMNFPSTDIYQRDILEMSPDSLERVDVLIGSPPCTHFSLANRGGNGDKAAGLLLVKRFFEYVHELKPKYWIMENVPSLRPILERLLREDTIRLGGGTLSVPIRQVLSSADFGTPQSRRRLFSGAFPNPEDMHLEGKRKQITLGEVLKCLPDPCGRLPNAERMCFDPLYEGNSIPETELRDHFEDSNRILSKEDLRWSKKHKTEHSVYGRMDWPDRLNRPSRTITATRTRSSRSTIVVKCPHHSGGHYRTLTLRECASVQGFPATYQFWGDTLSQKNVLVGNAVPPPLARALAHAILEKEGAWIPPRPLLHEPSVLPEIIQAKPTRKLCYPISRRFRDHSHTDWSPSCRVELDNSGSHLYKAPIETAGVKSWVTRLYVGYAKEYRCYELDFGTVSRMVKDSCKSGEVAKAGAHFKALLDEAKRFFGSWLPDSITLQQRWAARITSGVSPEEVLHRIDVLVEKHLPKTDWHNVKVPKSILSKSLSPRIISRGSDADNSPPLDLPVRVLASALLLALACKAINSGRV